jgi:hypothetical protein
MNVEIGTEAAQFLEKKYINGIFVAVCNLLHLDCLPCIVEYTILGSHQYPETSL